MTRQEDSTATPPPAAVGTPRLFAEVTNQRAATKPTIMVMGGSLGGLTTALYLCDLGYRVDVYERSLVPLSNQGAGVALHPATVRYLVERQQIDLATFSIATRWLRYLDSAGNVAAEVAAPYRFSSYNALYHHLLRSFDPEHYHLGEMVVDFQQDAAGVTVHFADGRQQRCDLLVCADGIRSLARRLLLPESTLTYAGYVAWRGIIAQSALTPATRARLDNAVTYYLLPNSHLPTYPIQVVDPATGVAQPFVNWVWYWNVPEGDQLNDLLTDRTGTLREFAVGAGAVPERHIARLYAAAQAQLPAPLAELVQRSTHPFLQAIADCAVPRMSFGRVCLLGDAAFVTRPHTAAGTAKAAEDGYQLSLALAKAGGDVISALQQWEPAQLRLGHLVLERSRQAGQRVQFDNTWRAGDPLPVGLYQVGDSTLL